MSQQAAPKTGQSSDASNRDSKQENANPSSVNPNAPSTPEKSDGDSARSNGKLNPSF